MSETRTTSRRARRWPAGLAILAAGAALVAIPATYAGANGDGAPDGNSYQQTNLVSDVAGAARLTDPNLVNPWGLAFGPTTPAWVADNGADAATLYNGGFDHNPPAAQPLVVSIPGGAPTGQVFNGGDGFVVGSGATAGPARFIFDSEVGTITAWSPTLSPDDRGGDRGHQSQRRLQGSGDHHRQEARHAALRRELPLRRDRRLRRRSSSRSRCPAARSPTPTCRPASRRSTSRRSTARST